MDAKLTLSFDETIINNAKKFAEENGISLSRLIEILLRKATSKQYKSLEDLPISDWVMEVAEGRTEYQTAARKRKDMKDEFYKNKK